MLTALEKEEIAEFQLRQLSKAEKAGDHIGARFANMLVRAARKAQTSSRAIMISEQETRKLINGVAKVAVGAYVQEAVRLKRRQGLSLSFASDQRRVAKQLDLNLGALQHRFVTLTGRPLRRSVAKLEKDVNRAIRSVLKEGLGKKDSYKLLNIKLEKLGLKDKNPNTIKTWLRTGASFASNAARWDVSQNATGTWGYTYLTKRDDKVRPAHAEMDGYTRKKDDPCWLEIWPPNGWNCRCQIVVLKEPERQSRVRHDIADNVDEEFLFNVGVEFQQGDRPLSLADDCGAGSPGGKGFQEGNTCGSKGNKVIRYTHKDGKGLLNNAGLDRMRLTDDEESELVDVMDFGLQQPASDVKGTFYFTVEGEKKHKRLLELLKKASKSGIIRSEFQYEGKPNWESSDGQIAIDSKQVLALADGCGAGSPGGKGFQEGNTCQRGATSETPRTKDVRDIPSNDEFERYLRDNAEKWFLDENGILQLVHSYSRDTMEDKLGTLDASDYPFEETARKELDLTIKNRDILSPDVDPSTIKPDDYILVRHRTDDKWAKDFIKYGIDTRNAPPDKTLGRLTLNEANNWVQTRIEEPGLFVEPFEEDYNDGVIIQIKAKDLKKSLETESEANALVALYSRKDAIISGLIIPPEQILGRVEWDYGESKRKWTPNLANPNSGLIGADGSKATLSLSERLALVLADDCGAGSPGGKGFQEGNTCQRGYGGGGGGSATKMSPEKRGDYIDQFYELEEEEWGDIADEMGLEEGIDDSDAIEAYIDYMSEGDDDDGWEHVTEPSDTTNSLQSSRKEYRGALRDLDLLNRSIDEIGTLAGQMDGVRTDVYARESDEEEGAYAGIYLFTDSDEYEQRRIVSVDHNDELVVLNEYFVVDSKHRGSGLGTRIFARQVKAARDMGVGYLSTHAVRSDGMNGYYTWSRLGYDNTLKEAFGNIRNSTYEAVREAYPKATHISDLMRTKESRDWWKANGTSVHLKFDLNPDSLSMRRFEHYLEQKGMKL